MSLGEEGRDEGIERVTAAADPETIAAIDAVIDSFNASGRPWSANDCREFFPPAKHQLIGARVRAGAVRRPTEQVRIGYVPSDLPSTHHHPIAVWIGAEHVGQESA